MTTEVTDVVFVRHPAQRGLDWLRQARGMFNAARLPWLMLLLAFYLALAIVRMVPVIGLVAVPLLKPVFAVGFLAAAWTQERGGRPKMADLFTGFRANLGALLPLGLFFVLGITLATLATALVDGGKLLDLFSNPPPVEGDADAAAQRVEDVLLSTRVQLGMLFAALCAIPVLFAMWFAPALVVFQDRGPLAALVLSFRAAAANWRPLAVYALVVFVLAGVVPTFLAAMVQLLGSALSDAARAWLVYILILPYIAMVIATLQIADYVAYRDVFHPGETLTPLADGKSSDPL